MLVDLRPLLYGDETKMPISFSVTPDAPEEFTITSEVKAEGEVTKHDGALFITLTAKVPYKTICARCLCDVNGILDVCYERKILEKNSLSEQMQDDNPEEILFPNNGMLSLDDSIRDEIYLSFPMRVFCSEDCQGLCPICGKPKRLGCSCKQDESDPRWDVLKNWKAK